MKIRCGFVSNSSSSSFAVNIYGLEIVEIDVDTLIKKFIPVSNGSGITNDYSNCCFTEKLEILIPELYDRLPGIKDKIIMPYGTDDNGETRAFIGRELNTIGDNETGLEFKNFTQKVLENLFDSNISCSFIKEKWGYYS